MDKKEFSIAMHLIKKKLQGYELPKSLPTSLKADPSPMMGSFGTMPPQPQGMMGMAPGIGEKFANTLYTHLFNRPSLFLNSMKCCL